MKKLLLVAMLILGVVAGVFFMDTTPAAPLSVVITGVTNQEYFRKNIYFAVSNHTSQPYYFYSYPHWHSNGLWILSERDRSQFTSIKTVTAHAASQEIIHTYRNSGDLRVQVTCWLGKTPLQNKIDDWLQKLHLRPLRIDPTRKQIISTPTNFPVR